MWESAGNYLWHLWQISILICSPRPPWHCSTQWLGNPRQFMQTRWFALDRLTSETASSTQAVRKIRGHFSYHCYRSIILVTPKTAAFWAICQLIAGCQKWVGAPWFSGCYTSLASDFMPLSLSNLSYGAPAPRGLPISVRDLWGGPHSLVARKSLSTQGLRRVQSTPKGIHSALHMSPDAGWHPSISHVILLRHKK